MGLLLYTQHGRHSLSGVHTGAGVVGADAEAEAGGVAGSTLFASGSVGSVTHGELTTRLRDHDVDGRDVGSRFIGVLRENT